MNKFYSIKLHCADPARFLPTICCLIMYAGFANKTRTYCWHKWYRICPISERVCYLNLMTICYQFIYLWIYLSG